MAVVKPWWDIFPSTPQEAVVRTLDEPTVSPVGLFGIGAARKIIIKKGGRFAVPAIAGAGGFLFSQLFGGGGGTQEQKQDATITPTVTPTFTPEVPIDQKPTTITFAPVTTRTSTDIDYSPLTNLFAGGDIGYTGQPFNVGTTTIPTVSPTVTTSAEPYLPQVTVVPSGIQQAAEATQKPDNTLLLVIGAVALGAMFLMGRK